jgi:hypothetical protein
VYKNGGYCDKTSHTAKKTVFALPDDQKMGEKETFLCTKKNKNK